MKTITQETQSVRLMLVGDGAEEEELRQLVERLSLGNWVSFIGKIPNEKIPEYLAASDVFVLPSLSEGLPNVILEAMASGLPIVASKVGGLPEMIKNGENGFLVEPKSPEQIAKKVLLLLGDNELKEKISKNNKEKAKDYSWESIVIKLEKVYQSLL